MKRIAAATFMAACTGLGIFAQTPAPAFDVASVRPAAPVDDRGVKTRPHHVHTTPGNVVMRNIGMTEAIQWAYNVESYQVGGPAWMQETRFDIVAKAADPATDDQMRVMMQNLLASRFQLTVHRETKEMAGMALLLGKGGSKMKASEDEGESVFEGGGNNKPIIHMRRMSMHEFAALLSEPMHKPVIDLTEIKGTFNFTLDASNYVPPEPAPGQPRERDDETYMVLRALQDQLGLRLEPRKLTIDMVMVDRIEKVPTEN
jgi:uncharacterized protein (TIGR03435 family)